MIKNNYYTRTYFYYVISSSSGFFDEKDHNIFNNTIFYSNTDISYYKKYFGNLVIYEIGKKLVILFTTVALNN
jgi:hypothetical protein